MTKNEEETGLEIQDIDAFFLRAQLLRAKESNGEAIVTVPLKGETYFLIRGGERIYTLSEIADVIEKVEKKITIAQIAKYSVFNDDDEMVLSLPKLFREGQDLVKKIMEE